MSLPMNLPLYNSLHSFPPTPEEIGIDGHQGLWFSRFYSVYPDIAAIKPKADMLPKEKEALIQQEITWLRTFDHKKVGDSAALQTKALQQSALCRMLQGQSSVSKTQWHFVTGMGLSHPIENGMAWHPTLGVPYLTGASVKGMVRAWLEAWDVEEDGQQQKQRLQQWFGSDNKEGNASQAGGLIFFDALPTQPVTLGIDIMTPHMGKWYAEGQHLQLTSANNANDHQKLPADWHNPVPVQFLVVKKACLQFCVAPRNKHYAKEIDMQCVVNALNHALEWIGAGAKTAAGYGRFETDSTEEQRLNNVQIKAARQQMTPEDAFRDYLRDKDLNEKELAEKLGKKSKKTQQEYQEKGCAWEDIIAILLEEKSSLIHAWQQSAKNTAEYKAYKKLQPFLPTTFTSFANHLILLLDHKANVSRYDPTTGKKANTIRFDPAFYQQQALDSLLLIGAAHSDWFDIFETLRLDEREDLETAIDELIEADTQVKQQQLEPFVTAFSEHLTIPCELVVLPQMTDQAKAKAQQQLQEKHLSSESIQSIMEHFK